MLTYSDGSCLCGTVTVGERGQVVIPKKVREHFKIQPGDTLTVIGDQERGITFIKASSLAELAGYLGRHAEVRP